MPLNKGARLGPYEIVTPLGAGGMGEVYRGRDTRLDRSVAIKVVLAETGLSLEARHRFEREARAISSLQHPHICALHDVGSQDGLDFLVMELVEGETLAARLERGPLPLAEALRYGAQMADALDGAHRCGIVHRDLKPANVMLTPRGVKLLDFGLARRQAVELGQSDLSVAPTRAAPLTAAGTIVGTLHYMSPEQLEGRAVDARSDVFSLGVVLYEMVTGSRAFDGGSPVSLISSILRDQPPPASERAPLAPPALDRLIEACLVKDPERRWQSAHDVAIVLDALAARTAGTAPAAAPTPRRRRLPWALAAVAAAAAVALGLALADARREAAAPQPRLHFELSGPAGGRFYDSVESVTLALSPDGSTLAFVAQASETRPPMVWLRPLGEPAPRPLAGTEGAFSLFWSPDGRAIAFFAGGRLKRLDLAGGTPMVLCEVPSGLGMAGSWGKSSLLFATIQGDGIYRVDLAGGTPSRLVTSDRADGDPTKGRLVWPWYLDDGERFLYLESRPGGGFDLRLAEADGRSRTVGQVASRVETAGDLAVFVRDGALIAERLDLERGAFGGSAIVLAPAVRTFGSTGSADFAARPKAVVVATRSDSSRLTWYDPGGRVLGTVGEPALSSSLAISPDGRRAIQDRLRPELGTYDLWMVDLERGVESRLTSQPGTEAFACWLPGGREIVYSASSGEASPRLVRRDLGSGADQPLRPHGGFQIAIGVRRGGDLLFRERSERGFELWSLPSTGGEPTPLPSPQTGMWSTSLSPDGELLAYVSAESGRNEVYLRPVGGGESVRASIDGARFVRFGRADSTVFFVSAADRLMAASFDFDGDAGLRVEKPRELFALPPLGWETFEVAPDGRFLGIVREVESSRAPLEAITGWQPGR